MANEGGTCTGSDANECDSSALAERLTASSETSVAPEGDKLEEVSLTTDSHKSRISSRWPEVVPEGYTSDGQPQPRYGPTLVRSHPKEHRTSLRVIQSTSREESPQRTPMCPAGET